MAESWQDDDVPIPIANIRDEDDDAPDDWENELEDKPKKVESEETKKTTVKAPPTSKNKLSKKKFAADGNNSEEEFLESLKEPTRHYTEEELDELRKRAEIQKEALKLSMAGDLLGATGEQHSLDNINLTSKEEFLDYSFRLYNRLDLLSKSEYYYEFIDHLFVGLTKTMSSDAVKRMATKLQQISTQKQNEERERKTKNKIKKPVKPQVVVDRKSEYDSFLGEDIESSATADPQYDEDNDFM